MSITLNEPKTPAIGRALIEVSDIQSVVADAELPIYIRTEHPCLSHPDPTNLIANKFMELGGALEKVVTASVAEKYERISVSVPTFLATVTISACERSMPAGALSCNPESANHSVARLEVPCSREPSVESCGPKFFPGRTIALVILTQKLQPTQ